MKLEDKIIKLRIKNKLNKKIISEYLGISEDEYYRIENRKLVTSLFRFNGLTATDLRSIAYFHKIIIQYKKISNLIEACHTI